MSCSWRLCAPTTVLALTLPITAGAVWTVDPAIDVPVCTAANTQDNAVAVSDGDGGTVVAWEDARSGAGHIYVQRLDADGVATWATDGVVIADAGGAFEMDAASDGNGGIFVTWVAGSAGVHVQHVDSSGTPQWVHGGVRPTTTSGIERYPSIVADGAGGAYVAWQDYRSGWTYHIYAQRLDGSGAAMWVDDGRLASDGTDYNQVPDARLAPSGDLLVTCFTGNLEASRLAAANGASVWPQRGVVAAESVSQVSYWDTVSDGEGGLIFAFLKDGDRVYASRIDSAGTRIWPDDVPVGTISAAFPVAMIEDGSGGAFIAWRDTRYSLQGTIAAQYLDATGAAQWPANGVECSATWTAYTGHGLAPDGAGGIIVEWQGVEGLRAQRVGPTGVVHWDVDGVLVSNAWLNYYRINVLADGAGGAIAVYTSAPNSGHTDIHAERVDGTGSPGGVVSVPPSAGLADRGLWAHPNPFRSDATINLVGAADGGDVRIDVLDVAGRRIRALHERAPREGGFIRWDGRDDAGKVVPAGVYYLRDARRGRMVRIVRLN